MGCGRRPVGGSQCGEALHSVSGAALQGFLHDQGQLRNVLLCAKHLLESAARCTKKREAHRATAAAPLLRCLCWEVIVVTGAVPSHSSDGQSVTLSQRALGPDRPPAFYKEIRHRIISATLLSALKKPPLSIFWERARGPPWLDPSWEFRILGGPHPLWSRSARLF